MELIALYVLIEQQDNIAFSNVPCSHLAPARNENSVDTTRVLPSTLAGLVLHGMQFHVLAGELLERDRGFLLAVQTRGEALLALGRPDEAVVEFERIIGLQNRTLTMATLARIARLWLGRAHLAAGDSDAARAAYEEFFDIMQNADEGIPLIDKARQEYATIPGAKG